SKLIPVEQACELIIEGQASRIDTALCNGERMLLLAGIGFEQKMIEKAHRDAKNESGQLAYLQGFWQALSEHEAQDYTVTLDDNEPQSINTNSLIIANAAPFTTLLAQSAGQPDHNDGLLDVNWLTPNSEAKASTLSIAELVFSSITQTSFAINSHHTNAKRVSVSAEKDISYVIDGEVKTAEKLVVEVSPKSLSVIMAET
ncbi:MAG: hypothetical protein VX076_10710, partial [Pseudomonadota bacterium]|nr:hypothetical protein [Pseudomonadota bacterium]